MKALTCPAQVLKPILERIELSDLCSVTRYRELAAGAGLVAVDYQDQTPDLVRHYERILEGIEDDQDLARHVSAGYLERARTGLQHWIDGGRNGHLQWGMFHFRKPTN
jgi:sarcosine/dimethylglycine N-methyltransferase